VVSTDEAEDRLFLNLAKDAFARQIERRVRSLARSYVERWMAGELWLYRSVVRDHATELRMFKPIVLETLRTTTIDEMLAICRETRPDLDDLWRQPAARDKLEREIEKSVAAIEAL